jgi:hypothetical protein
MTQEEILSNLCYYDLRNPDGVINDDYVDDHFASELGEYSQVDCYCDNCFYGRTKLAEYILNLKPLQS